MREFKFRVYDENHECIHYSGIASLDWLFELPERHGGNIMQYTGIKDKNGKDIYEGDIVIASTTIDSDSAKKMFVYWDIDRCIFATDNYNCSSGWFPHIRKDNNLYFEIIGNIYENPELLTKE